MGPRPRADRGAHAGVVATPRELARRLSERLAAPPGVPGPPVLDPACGEGELLLAVLEAAGGSPEFAARYLFGIEIDAAAAQRARDRLRAAAGLPRGSPLEAHIRTLDALDPSVPWTPGAWVIANPPWLSFSGRHAGARAGRRREGRGSGWPALHSAFLARIARHVGDEGTGAAVLVPAAVTELERYGPLRAAVTEWAELSAPPEELGEDAFPGVTEPAVLLALAPKAAPSEGSQRPWTGTAREHEALLAELERFPRLPPRTFADPGVHTGNSADALVHRKPIDGASPVYQGRDLRPFDLGPPSAYLRTDLEPTRERRFRIGALERYGAFPVLLRQTADRPIAALHAPPSYFRNSLLACRDVPGLDAGFVVAVLNGPVAAAWHRAMFRDARQRTFPQVKVRHLASQPFPIVHRDEDPGLHDRIADLARSGTSESRHDLQTAVLDAFGVSPGTRETVMRLAGSTR